eukprot:m.51230 g.51230  ORF g.51230 m.51230 type:complete len:94 (+) comp10719_c0_seq1:304-585(+)
MALRGFATGVLSGAGLCYGLCSHFRVLSEEFGDLTHKIIRRIEQAPSLTIINRPDKVSETEFLQHLQKDKKKEWNDIVMDRGAKVAQRVEAML